MHGTYCHVIVTKPLRTPCENLQITRGKRPKYDNHYYVASALRTARRDRLINGGNGFDVATTYAAYTSMCARGLAWLCFSSCSEIRRDVAAATKEAATTIAPAFLSLRREFNVTCLCRTTRYCIRDAE